MQILNNQPFLKKQGENYIAAELSNVATVIQTPQLFVDYFNIDPDKSTLVTGFKNIEDYIGPHSNLVFNEVENLPMSGIDNLVEQATWDDEVGYDEDFESQGIIFPNTITPRPGDLFIIHNSQMPALYQVIGTSPVTVRSNPFVEIQFKLFSRNPETIDALRRQVQEQYMTTVTAIGMDKTLVIKKSSYFEIEDHVNQYIDLVDMYKMLFYDRTRSAFIFDGIYDEKTDKKLMFLDITLWKLMFNEGIVVYDDVVTYAINNFKRRYDQVFISCPDIYLEDHAFKRSILWRIYSKDHKHKLDEFKFPQAYDPDPRIGKYKGTNLIYFEFYGDSCDCNPMCMTCPTWDEEFVLRLKNNDPYPTEGWSDGYYEGGENCYCDGQKVTAFNPYLRNAIIAYYNNEAIDWENLQVEDKKTCENYFLIPILLAAYKQYIHDLQK